METTVDQFGRILIPKSIRDDFGLKAGAHLRIEEGPHEIILKPLEEDLPWLVKDGVMVFNGETTGDVTGAIKDHRSERLKHISRGKRRRQ